MPHSNASRPIQGSALHDGTPLGRPTYMVQFKADGVVRYRYSEDEAVNEVLAIRNVRF